MYELILGMVGAEVVEVTVETAAVTSPVGEDMTGMLMGAGRVAIDWRLSGREDVEMMVVEFMTLVSAMEV